MVDFNKIKELRAEIDKLLEERPEYRKLQRDIDIALRKAGDPALAKNHDERARIYHNRQAILQDMMLTTWRSILPKLEELKEATRELAAIAKKGLE